MSNQYYHHQQQPYHHQHHQHHHQSAYQRQQQRQHEVMEDVFAFVVRHGERCDNSESQEEQQRVQVAWDPPLTKQGAEQARLTGQFLFNKLKESNVQYLVLESSPFLRCMETAAIIAKTIGIQRIQVNYLLAEWMKEKFYPHGDPYGKLLVETMPSQAFCDQHLQSVQFCNFQTNKEHTVFPEQYGNVDRRSRHHIKQLRHFYSQSKCRVGHISISHGSFTRCFANAGQHLPRSIQADDLISYCGVAALRINGQSAQLCLSGSNGHLPTQLVVQDSQKQFNEQVCEDKQSSDVLNQILNADDDQI